MTSETINGLTAEQHNLLEFGKTALHLKSMDNCCAAKSCTLKVPRHMLMCKRHWFLLPMDLRGKINRLYDGGVGFSVEYFIAVGQAVEELL